MVFFLFTEVAEEVIKSWKWPVDSIMITKVLVAPVNEKMRVLRNAPNTSAEELKKMNTFVDTWNKCSEEERKLAKIHLVPQARSSLVRSSRYL